MQVDYERATGSKGCSAVGELEELLWSEHPANIVLSFRYCCTDLHSKIERGDKEEATQAYILVRRGDDDEVNKVI